MSLAQKDDLMLLKLYCQSSNKEAFAELYKRYIGMVVSVCLKYTKNQSQAEDLSQQLFEKLYKRVCRYDIQNFRAWLYQSAKNECLMFLRKHNPEIISSDLLPQHSNSESDASEHAEKIALENNIVELEKAIAELKDDQKKCIELFYIEKLSYAQIEDKTGWDFKKIKSSLQNAKRNLKNALKNGK